MSEAVATEAVAVAPVEDAEDISLVAEFQGVLETIERVKNRAGSEKFVQLLQKSFAAQTAKELQLNVYELMHHIALRGGMIAQATENLEDDFEELEKEVINQGRILRDMLSTSIVGLAFNLARLCAERVPDPEIKTLAAAIMNAVYQPTAEAATGVPRGTPETTQPLTSVQEPVAVSVSP